MHFAAVPVLTTLLLATVSSSYLGDHILQFLDTDVGLEDELLNFCLDRNILEHEFLQLLDRKEDLSQCFVSPASENRKSRQFELTTTLFRLIYNIIGRTGHSPKSLRLARQMNKLQEEIPDDIPFPCQTNQSRSSNRPTRADRVRPGDIDVVAALGDSLVAANGAVSTNVFQVLIANRGVSWAIGGQDTWRQYLTLPNILKEFNPRLIGYSTGDSLYSANRQHNQLNAAEPGARSSDLPAMADTLIARMRSHPQINLEKDWKMVTIFIGAMDFCFHMCFRDDPTDILDEHREHLTIALEKLQKNLPRTIVNVVLQVNLGDVIPRFRGLPWLCARLYKAYECPCLVSEQFYNVSDRFRQVMSSWQDIETEVVNSKQFRTRRDFAVVIQPFFLNTEFPTVEGAMTDMRYLSHDCFHPSQLGHAKAANALWNNIMEPVGKKSTSWDVPFLTLACPTPERPYIPVRETCKSSVNDRFVYAVRASVTIFRDEGGGRRRFETFFIEMSAYAPATPTSEYHAQDYTWTPPTKLPLVNHLAFE